MKASDLCFSIQKHVQKISAFYNKKGLCRTIIRFFTWVSYRKEDFVFFEIDLPTMTSNVETRDKCKFTALTKEDVEQITDYFDGWFSQREALERLNKGARLFALCDEEKLVSLLWVEFRRAYIPPLGLIFAMPDTVAYIAYTYTLPEYRKGGIGYYMHHRAMEYLRSHGYRTALGIVSFVNDAALKIGKASGFSAFQTVLHRRFFFFLKYYRVRNPDTGEEKIFWRTKRTDHQIWRTFSRSHQV